MLSYFAVGFHVSFGRHSAAQHSLFFPAMIFTSYKVFSRLFATTLACVSLALASAISVDHGTSSDLSKRGPVHTSEHIIPFSFNANT